MKNTTRMKRAREEVEGNGDQENVLDETDFDRIRGELQKYDEQREKIIKSSRYDCLAPPPQPSTTTTTIKTTTKRGEEQQEVPTARKKRGS